MHTCAEMEASVNRKEKRKEAKKNKRKQKRKEVAEKLRAEEEASLADPEEQRRIQLEEEEEKQRQERDRKEFEERERLFLEELARRKAQEEEKERIRAIEEEEEERRKQNQAGCENEENCDEEWEYVEDGPPEIIWQGNEIIVKKNRVRVKKKAGEHLAIKEDPSRPTSNPLPPESDEHNNTSTISAQELLEDVAQQTPNFGTEQDKAHCPFHIKTGACRFGSRCSRIHFYPDKSCTLLIKNMYNGPGLVLEQDEGLENRTTGLKQWRYRVLAMVGLKTKKFYTLDYFALQCTDEEVEHSYEEFYEDVHTEFLKFGELVNFKVCRNSSSHLRGNVYIHYKSLDSAMLAYCSINGRYFAGKQITCEFVSVTKWKVAICGEFMRSKLVTCSRGTACNFIHCFRNPGGDYEWANWDKPPPKYWIKEMSALFGYSYDEPFYDRKVEEDFEHTADVYRQHSERYQARESRRSRSRENKSLRSHNKEHDARKREQRSQPNCHVGKRCEEDTNSKSNQHHHRHKSSSYDGESDRYWSGDIDGLNHSEATRKRSRHTLSEKTQTKVFRSSSSSSDSEHRTQSKDHHDNIVYSKRRSVEWQDEENTDGHQDKRKDSRHRTTKRKSSRYLSDDSSLNDAKRSDEDFDSDCGYKSRSSRGTRHHSIDEKVDETVRWEPKKEVTGDYHGKHLDSGKKSHRSHYHSRNHKGKS